MLTKLYSGSKARVVRGAPTTARHRILGPRPGGAIPSGRLAYTSFAAGEGHRLRGLVQSLFDHEPDCQLLAVDDCSVEDVRDVARDPRVDLFRRWRPCGYPTGLTGLLLGAFELLVERYQFDVLLKIDTDALCLRPGLFEETEHVFTADPTVGMVGTYLADASAETDEHRFAWLVPVIEQEARRDPVLRRALEAAQANGYRDGEHIQGGVYLVSRPALEALRERGLLAWRPRRGALLYDDMIVSMFIRSVGFRLCSLGADGGTIRSAATHMPLSLSEVCGLQPAAVHTVKRGLGGESEAEVRAFLRECTGA